MDEEDTRSLLPKAAELKDENLSSEILRDGERIICNNSSASWFAIMEVVKADKGFKVT
jgi:hypothetical protein